MYDAQVHRHRLTKPYYMHTDTVTRQTLLHAHRHVCVPADTGTPNPNTHTHTHTHTHTVWHHTFTPQTAWHHTFNPNPTTYYFLFAGRIPQGSADQILPTLLSVCHLLHTTHHGTTTPSRKMLPKPYCTHTPNPTAHTPHTKPCCTHTHTSKPYCTHTHTTHQTLLHTHQAPVPPPPQMKPN